MAKLYCILAREAETGLIFRRGPSKQVCLISWNLKNNTFVSGQWFKGRIYERKCDLSPDGKKLAYHAAKHHGTVPSLIAVSTPPFLTAHVLWKAIGTWNGQTLFETNNILALWTYRSDISLEPALEMTVPRQLHVTPRPWPGYFHKLADHDRLLRDGWIVHSGNPLYRGGPETRDPPVFYRKYMADETQGAHLELSATSDGSCTYKLRDDFENEFELAANWADIRGRHVFFSQGGKLFSRLVAKKRTLTGKGSAQELADFSDMKFAPVEAPDWALKW
jgi:hypothetical protein